MSLRSMRKGCWDACQVNGMEWVAAVRDAGMCQINGIEGRVGV